MPKSPLEKAARKFLKLNEERKGAERAVSSLEKQLTPLREVLIAQVKRSGGKKRTIVAGNVRVALEQAVGNVRWKEEFIRVTSEAAASKIEPPKVERLRVELV